MSELPHFCGSSRKQFVNSVVFRHSEQSFQMGQCRCLERLWGCLGVSNDVVNTNNPSNSQWGLIKYNCGLNINIRVIMVMQHEQCGQKMSHHVESEVRIKFCQTNIVTSQCHGGEQFSCVSFNSEWKKTNCQSVSKHTFITGTSSITNWLFVSRRFFVCVYTGSKPIEMLRCWVSRTTVSNVRQDSIFGQHRCSELST